MATKTKPTPQKEEAPEKEGAAETPTQDFPLLDLSDAAVRKMIKLAKKRGYVTHDQINAVLPSEEVSSDQIEDVFAMLNEMGINVVEQEEAEAEEDKSEEAADDDDTDTELVEVTAKPLAVKETKEPSERTDDPVRMYLREMGSVELLSREGEIAIAKRIEAGREAMIAGLCESPLTFQAIIIWRDEINDAKVFLRDIIDLEATYAGPDGKQVPQPPGAPGAPGAPTEGGAPGCARRDRCGAARGANRPDAVQARAAGGAAAPRPATARTTRRASKARTSPTTRTRTTSRTRSRSPRSRPSSSRRFWRPSTPSPTTTRSCAACRTRTSRASSRTSRSRPRRSASTSG